MTGTIVTHEPLIRLGTSVAVLLTMMLWEFAAPRRPQHYHRAQRWPHNLLLVALDSAAVRLLVPLGAVGAALVSGERGWGLFNLLRLPSWLEIVLAVLVLDLVIYFQHRLFHAVPWLWRLHRVHHADLEFDVTTGVRFHPLEILLSMGIKLVAVVFLGAPALAVLIFEVLLNVTSLFNHGNVRLPKWLDRRLRLLVVTPEMHRVHHSIIRREIDSNFGFNLPWWDHLFGTYCAQPAAGHLGMTIGIDAFREARELRLDRLLLQPFRSASPSLGKQRGDV
jgi:sterol desaturase/sphingolipid hydroxylase (fatty acid hydroxylase superfamily)